MKTKPRALNLAQWKKGISTLTTSKKYERSNSNEVNLDLLIENVVASPKSGSSSSNDK